MNFDIEFYKQCVAAALGGSVAGSKHAPMYYARFAIECADQVLLQLSTQGVYIVGLSLDGKTTDKRDVVHANGREEAAVIAFSRATPDHRVIFVNETWKKLS